MEKLSREEVKDLVIRISTLKFQSVGVSPCQQTHNMELVRWHGCTSMHLIAVFPLILGYEGAVITSFFSLCPTGLGW